MNTTKYTTNIRSLASIAQTINRNLENPPLSKKARDKALEITSSNQHGKTLKGEEPRLFTLQDIVAHPKLAFTLGESIPNKARGNAVRELTIEDKKDIEQEIALVLAEHGLLLGKGFYADNDELQKVIGKKTVSTIEDGKRISKEVDLTVWHELFSRCRKLLRFDRKAEYYADRIDAYAPDDLLKLETSRPYTLHPCTMENIVTDTRTGKVISHKASINPERKRLATQAKVYKRALREAFKLDNSRKAKSKYSQALNFLRASVATVNGNGHGLDSMAKSTRAMQKQRFLSYLKSGLEALQGKHALTWDEAEILISSKI